ncbi:hypothetical protein FACS1894127_3260 [Clostridia bacterium]|nr:hypothetical protein FACS1894127_3260 [Clostridia bacterium]
MSDIESRGLMLPYACIYLTTVSLIAIILTIYDKHAAKRGLWRVSERALLLVSALGGSVVMLLIMRLIRHKTKHTKFMIGIPVIIVIQITMGVLYIWWRTGL